MNNITSTFSLEEMLTNAVRMNWQDLGAARDALVHIEYHRLPMKGGVEFLKVWSSTTYGEWDLACEYWADSDRAGRTAGLTFHPPFYSVQLGQMLMAIMQNQLCFADLAVQTRDGMIQVSAPTPAERDTAQAAAQNAFAECRIYPPETGTQE